MHDQANDLRRLVRRDGRPAPVHGIGRPRLVCVAGGKGGVGTTTVAINLAVALARKNTAPCWSMPMRTAATWPCSAAWKNDTRWPTCSRPGKPCSRRSSPDRGGIRVLPGVWATQSIADCWASAAARLIGPLEELGPHFDCVVLDVGDSLNRMTRQFWQAADLVLLVSCAELASVMGAYGSIKVLAAVGDSTRIQSLLNMVPTPKAADDTHARLALACRRFLAVQVANAGYLPADPDVKRSAQKREPFVTAVPRGRSARLLRRLAAAVAVQPVHVHQSLEYKAATGGRGEGFGKPSVFRPGRDHRSRLYS